MRSWGSKSGARAATCASVSGHPAVSPTNGGSQRTRLASRNAARITAFSTSAMLIPGVVVTVFGGGASSIGSTPPAGGPPHGGIATLPPVAAGTRTITVSGAVSGGTFTIAVSDGTLRGVALATGPGRADVMVNVDYKADQVHVPFIMKRRRWKPDDGAAVPLKKKP